MLIVSWAPKPYSNYQDPCIIASQNLIPAKPLESWMPRSASRRPFAQSDSLEVQGLGCLGFRVSGVQVLDFRGCYTSVCFFLFCGLFSNCTW